MTPAAAAAARHRRSEVLGVLGEDLCDIFPAAAENVAAHFARIREGRAADIEKPDDIPPTQWTKRDAMM